MTVLHHFGCLDLSLNLNITSALLRRNSDLLSNFKHTPSEFLKNFLRSRANSCLHVCYLFAPLKAGPVHYIGQRVRLSNERSNPTHSLFFFLSLSEFFRNVFDFFEGSSWISQLSFRNFSGRLLINFRNITGKNCAHYLP